MKLLILCLTVFTGLVFSNEPSFLEHHSSPGSGYVPDTDDALWTMSYVPDDIAGGWRWVAICDDFILDNDATVDAVRFWIVYTGTAAPADFEIIIAQDTGDSDPNNASIVWTETCPAVIEDLGYLPNFDGNLLRIDCAFAIPVELTGGERYFLEYMFHDDTVYDLGLLADFDQPPYDFGNIAWIYSGVEWIRLDDFGYRRTLFMDILGTWAGALQNGTWGSIKTLF